MNRIAADEETIESFLARVPLFEGLAVEQLTRLKEHASLKSFPKNTILITQGDTTNTMYVVISGQVKVFLSDAEGKQVDINFLEGGSHFGELALLDNEPRSASVMTTEQTQCLMLSKSGFEQCLKANPNLALTLINLLSRTVRDLTENVRSLALTNTYTRVTKVLNDRAQEDASGQLSMDKLTQQDIANMIGSSREMVSRILKDLTAGGYIKTERKKIIILKKLPRDW